MSGLLDVGTEQEWHARERKRLLAQIEHRRYRDEPMRQALTRFVGELERSNDQLLKALEWAHGFMSNTDKQAANRLLDKAGMSSYADKWDRP